MTITSLFPVPDHIKGPMTKNTPASRDRREWLRMADAAGLTRRQMAAALEVRTGTIWHICLKALGPKGRSNASANAARLKKLHEIRHGAKNGVTYAELCAAGLTAREAAERRGESRTAAEGWAKETGSTFADGRRRKELVPLLRAKAIESKPQRDAGYAAMLLDPDRHRLALMTPDQRADYDVMVGKNIPSDEAAAAVGCPEAGITAWRKAKASEAKAQARAKAQERKRAVTRKEIVRIARSDPEAAMLAMIQAWQRSTRGQHAKARPRRTDAHQHP